MSCVFCKIVNKEISSEVVFEDENILGFENIYPEAPVHMLFIPKKHIEWKDNLEEIDSLFFSKIIFAAKKVAQEKNIFPACKLIFNIGKTGHISHMHLHLLGGWKGKVPKYNITN